MGVSNSAPARRENVHPSGRPYVDGKFLSIEGQKFYLKGVTYGAFEPRPDGEYHDAAIIEKDFAQIAASGINTVRVPHAVPARSLLDAAARHGLRVMVGLAAEQYVGYLIDRKKNLREVEQLVLEQVRRCAGHPALLCYALGNEIPASLVRYWGRRRIELYLRCLYHAVKSEDPDGIVTYANYPTTEYLNLPWLDALCFNVYLENEPAFAAYLARLHNLAGDRPLIMGELGLDSMRHGAAEQARVLRWQLRNAFTGGCAGAIVFAWTDEWFRSGAPVNEWGFGLTDRDHNPKPALDAVRQAFAEVPFPHEMAWPRITVIVCTHNGARTIRKCLEGLNALDYPTREFILVDDGSTDGTAGIAGEFGVRVISTPHRGLSAARNTGLAAADGEIVAFIDDDAWPDPQWLKYLAHTFLNEQCAGVGGPNIEPPGDGAVADSVANSPGGPVHVLLTDTEAEHLPGCNTAFRREALEMIGGFDPRFLTAGDDVDVCWGLQAAGFKLVFSPAAVVWHRARRTVSGYWKQQFDYGRAEALLEAKWPDKYNSAGHPTWIGRVYGRGATPAAGLGGRIYGGIRGSAPFQFMYRSETGAIGLMLRLPEWYLALVALALLSGVGLLWRPLLVAFPLLIFAGALSLLHGALEAARTSFPGETLKFPGVLRRRCLIVFFHLLQPLARLSGRATACLHAWRKPEARAFSLPTAGNYAVICPDWESAQQTISALEETLRSELVYFQAGGSYAAWDFVARGGIIGGVRMLTAAEDLVSGQQLVRVRTWSTVSGQTLIVLCVLTALALAAAGNGAWMASALVALPAVAIGSRAVYEAGRVHTLVGEVLANLTFRSCGRQAGARDC